MLSDLIIQEFIRTGRLPDTVACLGNCDLDCPRADRWDSDNLVAADKDDLVGCWGAEVALRLLQVHPVEVAKAHPRAP